MTVADSLTSKQFLQNSLLRFSFPTLIFLHGVSTLIIKGGNSGKFLYICYLLQCLTLSFWGKISNICTILLGRNQVVHFLTLTLLLSNYLFKFCDFLFLTEVVLYLDLFYNYGLGWLRAKKFKNKSLQWLICVPHHSGCIFSMLKLTSSIFSFVLKLYFLDFSEEGWIWKNVSFSSLS